jgi:putative membrane protein
MHFLIRLFATTAAILLITYLLPGLMAASGFWAALVAAFALALVNALIRPIFVILTLPLSVLTLGLFLLVVNGLMLWLVAALVPGFRVNGFLGAVAGAILISIISWFLTSVFS